MFDTYVTVVGNILTAPEWRRTTQSKSLVANFKVASTARRLDREKGQWVDGNSLRVRVNCWRKLAEGVAASIMVGDPVVVVGRLYTRDWTDAEGNNRTLYEMEAVAVGHDLSRGRSRFVRNRPTLATSAVEDTEAETRVRGETTHAVPQSEAPARFGENLIEDPSDPDFGFPPPVSHGYDPVAGVRGTGYRAGLDGPGFDGPNLDGPTFDEPGLPGPSVGAPGLESAGLGGPGLDDAELGGDAADLDPVTDDDEIDSDDGGGAPDIEAPGETEEPGEGGRPGRSRRRDRRREPVPA
ncbi:single-stranded DNA-binding protein [Actinomycetes bacterium KLBMP 9797]